MALTIATGFVVDDAIVMIENITRYIEKGMKPLEAAFTGAAEIGFTIISLTVSLIAVLIPLLFMGDVVGRLFREFAVTLAITILISAVVSLDARADDVGVLARHDPTPLEPRRGLGAGFSAPSIACRRATMSRGSGSSAGQGMTLVVALARWFSRCCSTSSFRKDCSHAGPASCRSAWRRPRRSRRADGGAQQPSWRRSSRIPTSRRPASIIVSTRRTIMLHTGRVQINLKDGRAPLSRLTTVLQRAATVPGVSSTCSRRRT